MPAPESVCFFNVRQIGAFINFSYSQSKRLKTCWLRRNIASNIGGATPSRNKASSSLQPDSIRSDNLVPIGVVALIADKPATLAAGRFDRPAIPDAIPENFDICSDAQSRLRRTSLSLARRRIGRRGQACRIVCRPRGRTVKDVMRRTCPDYAGVIAGAAGLYSDSHCPARYNIRAVCVLRFKTPHTARNETSESMNHQALLMYFSGNLRCLKTNPRSAHACQKNY